LRQSEPRSDRARSLALSQSNRFVGKARPRSRKISAGTIPSRAIQGEPKNTKEKHESKNTHRQ
jgi:hypothetical protein